ncbi:MGMT family protein [Dokdonella sp.]|uniref:MGMT family protein n=1 Tax=Dokdonella sp. TaxID=2291710 RepID=UPI003AF671F9
MMSGSPAPASEPECAVAAIRRVIGAIPRGRVASYGRIAARAGWPRRARLVGRVLAETPEGLALPWFRVLRADGRLAFPPGSGAFREQVRLLAAEGVLVCGGRVDLARHGWGADLDETLWNPAHFAPSAALPDRPRKLRRGDPATAGKRPRNG